MDNVAQRANDLGLSGHAGIAIDGEYYDYGPSGAYYNSPGQPWWDAFSHGEKRGTVNVNNVNGKDLDLMRQSLTTKGIVSRDATIYENTIIVTKKQALILKNWWVNKYKNLGTYSVVGAYGDHCTNTVMESLYEAGIIGTGIVGYTDYKTEVADPVEFQANYLDKLKHQAGFLINGDIPMDLEIIPPNATAAVISKIKKEKVKL